MIAYITTMEDTLDDKAVQLAELYREYIKDFTPIDTGNLRDSYQIQNLGDGVATVFTDVEYAMFVEYNNKNGYMFNKGLHALQESGLIEHILNGDSANINVGTTNGYYTSMQLRKENNK